MSSPFEVFSLQTDSSSGTGGKIYKTGNTVFLFPYSDDLYYYGGSSIYIKGRKRRIRYTISYDNGTSKFFTNLFGYPYTIIGSDVPIGKYSRVIFTPEGSFNLSNFCLDFYVYLDLVSTSSGTGEPIFTFYGNGTDERFYLYMGPGFWRAVPYSSITDLSKYQAEGSVSLNKAWSHVVFICDGIYYYIYINGIQVYRVSISVMTFSMRRIMFYLLGGTSKSYFSNIRLSDFVRYTKNWVCSYPIYPPAPYVIKDNEIIYSEITNDDLILRDDDAFVPPEKTTTYNPDGTTSSGNLLFEYPYTTIGQFKKDKDVYEFKYKNIKLTNDSTLNKKIVESNKNTSSSVKSYLSIFHGRDKQELPQKFTIEFNIKVSNATKQRLYDILHIVDKDLDRTRLTFYMGNDDYQFTIYDPQIDKTYSKRLHQISLTDTKEGIDNELTPFGNYKDTWTHIAIVYDPDSYIMLFVNKKISYYIKSTSIVLNPYEIYIKLSNDSNSNIKLTDIKITEGILYNQITDEIGPDGYGYPQLTNTKVGLLYPYNTTSIGKIEYEEDTYAFSYDGITFESIPGISDRVKVIASSTTSNAKYSYIKFMIKTPNTILEKYVLEFLVELTNISKSNLVNIFNVNGEKEDQSFLNFFMNLEDYQVIIHNPTINKTYMHKLADDPDYDPENLPNYGNKFNHIVFQYDCDTNFTMYINGTRVYNEAANLISLNPFEIYAICRNQDSSFVKFNNIQLTKGIKYDKNFNPEGYNVYQELRTPT